MSGSIAGAGDGQAVLDALAKIGHVQTLILTYPRTWLATQPTSGKFVQLSLNDQPVLLFADATVCDYHNQLLGRFLDERSIAHRWRGTDLVVEDAGLAVTGGGRFRFDAARRNLRVWDVSGVYGPFDTALLATQLAAAGSPWAELALDVGAPVPG